MNVMARVLVILLVCSVGVNIGLVEILKETQDASELDWADPDKLREVDE